MNNALPSIVALGGGNGLSTLLRGVSDNRSAFGKVTVGVAMTDNGGSTGNFRKLGYPALGDARRAFAALSQNGQALAFGDIVNGDKLGNAWLADQIDQSNGDVLSGFSRANRALETIGNILPVTPYVTDLVAWINGEQIVHGETNIAEKAVGRTIEKVSLSSRAAATEQLLEEIMACDVVVLGPGSLYTSVIASTLPEGISRALCETNATIVYVGNVSTERGESQGYDVERHISELVSHIRVSPHYCLVNSRISRFDQDEDRLGSVNHITTRSERYGQTRIISEDLISDNDPLRHDPDKLAKAILQVAAMSEVFATTA